MYQYVWDDETGGLLLTSEASKFSKEPRPVYYRELDILGFDKYWDYPRDDSAPIMWAEANNYIYRGKMVAQAVGGSLYNAPELKLVTDDDLGHELLPVDVNAMVQKNLGLLETLAQETIRGIYNTYQQYKNKVDIFYVAFSGGKDSIVTLDLVQRALPHDAFIVLFGDTQMEFADTYETVEKVKDKCEKSGIRFYASKSTKTPKETWSEIGPPSRISRWCCSVHKTAPQILLLRELLCKPDFTGMAYVGVRADESVARSKYDYVSYGEKHKGQYSCNAILNWGSAEIYLYIFANGLFLNEAYKKGNRRAGCLICPCAAERNDYMNHYCYSEQSDQLVGYIKDAYRNNFQSEEALNHFIEVGGWKARKNGRDIAIPINIKEQYDSKSKKTVLKIKHPRTDWKIWIKTIGVLANDSSPYAIKYHENLYHFDVIENDDGIEVRIDEEIGHSNPEFIKHFKNVFKKSACCIACGECQADCPYGCLSFESDQISISDNCVHCSQCHKAEKGCLVYKSLELPKGGINMTGKKESLNIYSHHAPRLDWIEQYFKFKNEFDEKHNLGSQMYDFFKRFLRDAELLDKSGFSKTAEIIDKIGLDSEDGWAIMLVNLCCAPQLHWYVTQVGFGREYPKALLASMMMDAGAKESWTNDIFSSLVRMSELPLGKVGVGEAIREKNHAIALIRNGWENPTSIAVLYGLYKFSETCGDYYQFTLEELMDDTIERDGVSPTRIFGLDQDAMVRILNGLSVNYPEFISASFTLDLDTINLVQGKTSMDVLQLF